MEPLLWVDQMNRSSLAFRLTMCSILLCLKDSANNEENAPMKKSVFQGAPEVGTRVAGPRTSGATRVRSKNVAPPRAPRWVKILAVVALVLFVLFLILRVTVIPYLHRLSGHAGFDGQTPSVGMLIHGGPLG